MLVIGQFFLNKNGSFVHLQFSFLLQSVTFSDVKSIKTTMVCRKIVAVPRNFFVFCCFNSSFSENLQ